MISLATAKLVAQIAASFGVTKIASDIIKNNVVIMTTAQGAMVKVGSFVLGSMLVEQSSNHIDRVVDGVVHTWNERNNKDESDLNEVG